MVACEEWAEGGRNKGGNREQKRRVEQRPQKVGFEWRAGEWVSRTDDKKGECSNWKALLERMGKGSRKRGQGSLKGVRRVHKWRPTNGNKGEKRCVGLRQSDFLLLFVSVFHSLTVTGTISFTLFYFYSQTLSLFLPYLSNTLFLISLTQTLSLTLPLLAISVARLNLNWWVDFREKKKRAHTVSLRW